MFTSFTGSARPKRQVNLSGRNNNPFAAHSGSSRTSSAPQSAQNAVAQAYQERLVRQQERARPPAATKIQKTWRGHQARRDSSGEFRRQWDAQEGRDQNLSAADRYSSEEECFGQLQLLNRFASPASKYDADRLHRFAQRYYKTMQAEYFRSPDWQYARLRLAIRLMKTLKFASIQSRTLNRSPSGGFNDPKKGFILPTDVVSDLLGLLEYLARDIAPALAKYSNEYYDSLTGVAVQYFSEAPKSLERPILALLSPIHAHSVSAYQGFLAEGLCSPDLSALVQHAGESLVAKIDYGTLVDALNRLLTTSDSSNLLRSKTHEQLLWLLAYFIYFHQHNTRRAQSATPDAQYVRIVSQLVSFLADDIGSRLDTLQGSTMGGAITAPLPDFVRTEIAKLVNQENVKGLLANLNVATPSGASDDASTLASYALMLLRVFPRQGDEIRMWLYQGSTSGQNVRGENSLPAIKYFYQAASNTEVFREITKEPRAAVSLLQPNKVQSKTSSVESRDQQWRIILLFLELYTLPLKLMDDEEFLSGSSGADAGASLTRQSALPLYQVAALSSFLKNLAFSMYWNAPEISGIDAQETKTSLAVYFGRGVGDARIEEDAPSRRQEIAVAGVSGLTVEYVRGMVTGVLRMLYERDSRRKFLPRDHWLMTKYFEMDRFISSVVKEEEDKHRIERSYEEDRDQVGLDEDDDDGSHTNNAVLIGTSHTQQIRNTERLKRQQRQASRRKYMESVTPRLEILQNMPFFIPFSTRVQIFREFVTMDQVIRRGTADADEWRFAQMNSPTGTIARHRAKVRRKSIFDDAYNQFYELGEGLKEPIQIRFVDEFDTIEEGIDGGGVTKEFLTSITAEAFGADNGLESLFVENDQHLLYPNPSAVEERKETLRQAMYKEGSPDWIENIRDLLRRYEFLGRVIGKCLYEGILVDIHFAPFFLLKWALTGGSGAAAKETGYRANINDLRDLDEGLYQGLLQLKNYPGNVEDLSLTFSVDDELRISPTQTKTVNHELQRGGEQIPVTNSNRLIYIANMARYRLQIQSQLQTNAFLRGLGTIVSPSWLNMFNQSELQTLVGGTSTEINISDLRTNTQYGGIYSIGDDGAEHPSIQLFWKVMQSLDDSDKKKVLKFVTSTPRAPLLGFGNLNPRFSIRDSGADQTRLPSTSTCVNLLKLPIYRDEKTLKERLLYSVNSGAGFNLS